ncbi:hypothetical protein ACIPYU_19305 [Paenarthrobacter nicotinovorans]
MTEREKIIHAYLGGPRLAPYMSVSQNDAALAVELYEWNLRLGAAFQEVMMLLEVALRNAIDEQLRPWNAAQSDNTHNPGKTFNDEWISAAAIPLHGLMTVHTKNAIRYAEAARAKRPPQHPRKQAPISHDDLLSQLTFGTWPGILPNPKYLQASIPKTRIWHEAIVKAFPHTAPGSAGILQIAEPLKRLHNLRNRVAHGEQLLEVNVNARFGDALRILAAIDQELADWCVDVSRVRDVKKQRPHTR